MAGAAVLLGAVPSDSHGVGDPAGLIRNPSCASRAPTTPAVLACQVWKQALTRASATVCVACIPRRILNCYVLGKPRMPEQRAKKRAMHNSSTAPANRTAGQHCPLDSASSATSATAMPSV